MAITPDTDIYLLKCPLELSDEHQLRFASASAQATYFLSLPKLEAENCTYQRKDSVIRFPAHIDDLMEYNYVMYRNNNYSNKWFYAFITDMEFSSPSMTLITIKTDVWQTWQFDLTFHKSFIERECVSNDTPGAHTLPEGLELGEFEIIDQRYSTLSDDWCWCFATTKLPGNTQDPSGNTTKEITGSEKQIGGVFTSLYFFAVRNLTAAKNVITVFEEDGSTTSDDIINIYPVPENTVKTGNNYSKMVSSSVSGGVYCYAMEDLVIDDGVEHAGYSIQQPLTLVGNYTPVNKKLYTFPYSYFYASNGTGEDVVYHWEDFPIEGGTGTTGLTAKYTKAIVPSSGVSAKLFFTNYKNVINQSGASYTEVCYNNGVNFSKAPVCAWRTDYYTNWLTQNGVNVALSIGSNVIGAAAGLASSNVGATVGAAGNILNTLAEVHKASVTPNQAHGDVNTGDVMFGLTNNIIKFYMMSVRPEVAQIIDNYFSMYGYKVSTMKNFELHSRRYWNYIKTIGAIITADIPQRDLDEIKTLFNNGITLWHDSANFLNYSLTNSIL